MASAAIMCTPSKPTEIIGPSRRFPTKPPHRSQGRPAQAPSTWARRAPICSPRPAQILYARKRNRDTPSPPAKARDTSPPPLTASLTHPHGSNHEGSKGSRTGAGTQGQEKAPNQEQPQISTPAECTSRKIWPWRFLKAWIWIKKPTRERGRAGERTTNLTD